MSHSILLPGKSSFPLKAAEVATAWFVFHLCHYISLVSFLLLLLSFTLLLGPCNLRLTLFKWCFWALEFNKRLLHLGVASTALHLVPGENILASWLKMLSFCLKQTQLNGFGLHACCFCYLCCPRWVFFPTSNIVRVIVNSLDQIEDFCAPSVAGGIEENWSA